MTEKLIKEYVENNYDHMFETLRELCNIPAPSHLEHNRAKFCKEWLENIGAKGVYIDDALNVIYPINCENSDKITVFAAHTDTVFPDLEPMPYHDDGEKIYSPGVSDDTASLVVLMYMAKFFTQNNLVPENGIMFVGNSCEEGLGNLKGTRQLFKDFSGRIDRFISFDSILESATDTAVGSHRYEVEVTTEGGHSYGAFGNNNAIAKLSSIISRIYEIQVPQKEGVKTTYNVGSIEGGTSVNTIAQSAKMLCEYRSSDKECLEFMENKFIEIFESAKTDKVSVIVTKVGDRPCSDISPEKIDAIKRVVEPIYESVLGAPLKYKSGSTDCNIPFSMGISSLCIGTNIHGKVHTREEWLDKASMKPGLEIAIKASIALTL